MNLFLPLAVFVHTWDHPFMVKFPPGWPLPGIRWYGVAYVLGFFIALGLMRLYAKWQRLPLRAGDRIALLTWLIVGVIVGGRLGYMLLYDWANFCAHPLSLFAVHKGGMASHGGFVGVAFALILFAKSRRISVLALADVIVSLAPPGIFLGRVANFINGELYGKITDVAWGVVFKTSAPFSGYPMGLLPARHPSQLYEAVLEGLLLLVYTQWLFWKRSASFRIEAAKDFLPAGSVAARWLMAYCAVRIFCELFREPDADLLLGLSRGTLYSLGVFIFGALMQIILNLRARRV